MAKYGAEYLRRKLDSKREGVLMRYEYYEMKNSVHDFQISTPPSLSWFHTVNGWCAKAVDTLADRIIFHGFKNDNFGIMDIYDQNNPDVLFDSAILSALISSCSFIYIRNANGAFPVMEVIDGANATGTLDQTTGLLTEGYAVLERDEYEKPVKTAYFEPYQTTYTDGTRTWTERTTCGYPLLVPVVFRPHARKPFGQSRISKACMSIVQSAQRTIKRSEIAAEFYSYPQKYATGLDQSIEGLDRWKASMSALITFTKDADGDAPKLGQFQAASFEPHLEQFKMFAAQFAGETGLTLEDLGFSSGNPASNEAIKAEHENLRLTAKKAQRTFGAGFLNAGFLAACLRDGVAYNRYELVKTIPVFAPIFEPDAAGLASIGDGLMKLNEAVPGAVDNSELFRLTGLGELNG